MKNYEDSKFCLACGYDLEETLRQRYQTLCECCNVQIGYTYDLEGNGAKEWREHWLSNVASPQSKAMYEKQKHNIPKELQ